MRERFTLEGTWLELTPPVIVWHLCSITGLHSTFPVGRKPHTRMWVNHEDVALQTGEHVDAWLSP